MKLATNPRQTTRNKTPSTAMTKTQSLRLGLTSPACVSSQDLVIPRVRFEPEGKCIANPRDDSDQFVDQNVQRHAGEHDFRQSTTRGLNQCHRGDNRRSRVTETGNETEQRIETEAEFRSWNAQEIIHDQRDPSKQRLELGAALLFLGRKNFPLDFL